MAEQLLLIRRATPVDAEVCGKICFEAFAAIAHQHNFPLDFPIPAVSMASDASLRLTASFARMVGR